MVTPGDLLAIASGIEAHDGAPVVIEMAKLLEFADAFRVIVPDP